MVDPAPPSRSPADVRAGRPAAPRRPARGRRAALAVLLAVCAGPACSPEYNWRELRFGDDRVMAMLPGKPADDARDIDLDGLKVRMSMHGAQAGGNAFAVAAVRLPSADDALRERVLAAMRAQMVRNLGGAERGAEAQPVPVVDGDGREVARAPGLRIEAAGQAQGKPAVLLGRFFGRGDRAWQAVVIGPDPDREQAKIFLESVRVMQ